MNFLYNYHTAGGKDVIIDFITNKVSKAEDMAVLNEIVKDTKESGIECLRNHLVYIDPNNYYFNTESLTKGRKNVLRIYEIKYSDYRILYTTKGKFVYFLHIFMKKTNKCPPKELNKAISRAKIL